MNKPHLYLTGLFASMLLLLAGGCDSDFPMPIIRDTYVTIEGYVTTNGGATPIPNMQIKLSRDRPLSLDNDKYFEKTDSRGYYRFKFKANHELNERRYALSYDIYDVDDDTYFCPTHYTSIGYLPSADTILEYNFQLPRKTAITAIYKDEALAREYELNTIFRFTCGLDSEGTRFMEETGAVSMDYTDNPLLIPSNTPVIVVTRGVDRKLSKPLEKLDTIFVPHGTSYLHEIDF
ncbi:hypothetical protein D770_13290 [Flammeovirgaceae bacterium 311]|nr:hypothetical protein D770_13290 [Flammeovirgaceae bacterium 311]